MAENAKDTKKQAALREQIEHHPIWNYPPEELPAGGTLAA